LSARWEDYEITHQNGRFGHFGNGWTVAERDGGETAEYVRDVDLPEGTHSILSNSLFGHAHAHLNPLLSVPGGEEAPDSWRRRQFAAPLPPIEAVAGYSADKTASSRQHQTMS
jgi:hypothetical protein